MTVGGRGVKVTYNIVNKSLLRGALFIKYFVKCSCNKNRYSILDLLSQNDYVCVCVCVRGTEYSSFDSLVVIDSRYPNPTSHNIRYHDLGNMYSVHFTDFT